MRHRDYYSIRYRNFIPRDELDSVLRSRRCRFGKRILYEYFDTIANQFLDDIRHAGISDISTVLFEGQTQHIHRGAPDRAATLGHELHRLFGDELPHAIVDMPSRKDHLRLITDHFRLMRKVIGVDADAVAPYEPGPEFEEIPFRAGCFQRLGCVDAQTIENDRQLVHERNVEVALGVLDDLRRLRDFDAGCAVDAQFHYCTVERSDAFEGFRIVARHHLYYAAERVLAVARVDAFGRVAHVEVLFPF